MQNRTTQFKNVAQINASNYLGGVTKFIDYWWLYSFDNSFETKK